MSYTQNFRGGTTANFTSYIDWDNNYLQDTVTMPTNSSSPAMNKNLAGTDILSIDGVVVTNGSGYTSAIIDSGYVKVYSGTDRVYFGRQSAVGGTINVYPSGDSFSGGLCGYYTWSTVPNAPSGLSYSASGTTVQVSITSSSDAGGQTITSYEGQSRFSVDGSSWGAWGSTTALTSGTVYFTSLVPGFYQFRVYAKNSNGSSAASTTSTVQISGGKRYNGSSWVSTSIAKRYNGSSWQDLATIKRFNGSAWIDVS